MASVSARPRADGTVAYRVQFRLTRGGPPTTLVARTLFRDEAAPALLAGLAAAYEGQEVPGA